MPEQVCPHCKKSITEADLVEYRKKLEFDEVFKSQLEKLKWWDNFLRNCFISYMLGVFLIGTALGPKPFSTFVWLTVGPILFCLS